jgi:hypothetical protein
LKGRIISVGDGQSTSFWEGPWSGVVTLKEKFHELFDICTDQDKNVAYMAARGWRMNFRRWLDKRAQNQSRQPTHMLSACPISTGKDTVRWAWEKSELFSVKSMYEHLFSGETNKPNKGIWKSKVPLKIKIFLWLIQHNAILTKDNLTARNWVWDKRCYFCNENENIEHLFFGCSATRYIWSLISFTIQAPCRPASFSQFWEWAARYMPCNKKIHMAGL